VSSLNRLLHLDRQDQTCPSSHGTGCQADDGQSRLTSGGQTVCQARIWGLPGFGLRGRRAPTSRRPRLAQPEHGSDHRDQRQTHDEAPDSHETAGGAAGFHVVSFIHHATQASVERSCRFIDGSDCHLNVANCATCRKDQTVVPGAAWVPPAWSPVASVAGQMCSAAWSIPRSNAASWCVRQVGDSTTYAVVLADSR